MGVIHEVSSRCLLLPYNNVAPFGSFFMADGCTITRSKLIGFVICVPVLNAITEQVVCTAYVYLLCIDLSGVHRPVCSEELGSITSHWYSETG